MAEKNMSHLWTSELEKRSFPYVVLFYVIVIGLSWTAAWGLFSGLEWLFSLVVSDTFNSSILFFPVCAFAGWCFPEFFARQWYKTVKDKHDS